jgi:predicted nucleic acid-binding protein
MAIVSDTSTVRALVHLGLLGRIAPEDRLIIPPAVSSELGHVGLSHERLTALRPIEVVRPDDSGRVASLFERLNLGEAEAIALALEWQCDALWIDERDGRRVARALGLPVVGAVGLLLGAKADGIILSVGPALDTLVDELNFFISPSLRARALEEAGELDQS